MSATRLLVGAAALAAVGGLGLLTVALWPEPPGVTYTNFRRVEAGMSRAEVIAVFGTTPGPVAPNGRSWVGLLLL